MPLIDVVNFNADASCLSSSKWIRCLEGGASSILVSVLRAYVHAGRKVNLGLIGATAADIAARNPEAIQLINEHPGIFEIVARPFAHDNALLRLPIGFQANVQAGLDILRASFRRVNSYFLAPEIMVTGEQIRILRELGITGVFLHKGRYDVSVTGRVPDEPFGIFGVFRTPMWCIPFTERDLEWRYLHMLHGTLKPEEWAAAIAESARQTRTVIWRDGESCLLHPLGPRHEAEAWAAEAALGVERAFLSELELGDAAVDTQRADSLRYFPMHSMRPWLDSMKMYWFVRRLARIEEKLPSLPDDVRRLWLLTINSDILSAAEKKPPIVDVSDAVLRADRNDPLWDGVIAVPESRQVILTRSERAGEGEDYLAYCELLENGEATLAGLRESWRASGEPHLLKALARVPH